MAPWCGTPFAHTLTNMGWMRGKSPLRNKRMHRKGGGRGEFGKYSGEEKLLNQRVAARKVDRAPENISNCLMQAEIEN